MVQASPELYALFGEDGFRANELIVPGDHSFLRPVSSEKRGLDGKRVHGALVDELHEHATPIVVNKMRAGTKGRRNAMIVKTTNSGFDRTSVCWNHHEYSRKVLGRTLDNETWFAFIAGLDPCQDCTDNGRWFPSDDCPDCDDWKTEGPHWLKANPNLGVSLPWQYVRERVAQAKGMPSEVSDVLRFNFCVWTQGSYRAIDMGRWASCQPMPAESALIGVDCYGCMDMGETDDFSAFGLLWVLEDGRVAVKMRYWLPSEAFETYPNRPYAQWQRAGLLTKTQGRVTDRGLVREEILALSQAHGVRSIFYDPKSALEMAQELEKDGLEMVKMGQGAALSEAIKRLLSLIVSGQLCHGNEEILSWMASNLVVRPVAGGFVRLDKDMSAEKIDGIAALVMGIDGAVVRRERQGEIGEHSVFVFGGRR
jgi:phage terminase large subunit-like protein